LKEVIRFHDFMDTIGKRKSSTMHSDPLPIREHPVYRRGYKRGYNSGYQAGRRFEAKELD